ELYLPEIGQRLEAEGVLRIALGDPHAGAAPQELPRHMAAEEAAAADQDDELVFERCEMSHDPMQSGACGAGSLSSRRRAPCRMARPPASRRGGHGGPIPALTTHHPLR